MFSCRLFETLQSLFWSIFGLISLYVTNVDADHQFTEFVGANMFGAYNIISLVVLLNMLIAMMNNSYQHIAVSTNQKHCKQSCFVTVQPRHSFLSNIPQSDFRTMQTLSGNLQGQNCGWVILKKGVLCQLLSTSSQAPNHSGTSCAGSRSRCGGQAPSALTPLVPLG